MEMQYDLKYFRKKQICISKRVYVSRGWDII